VFERFTDRARRVVVYAQEEARLLNHDCIGTEHILLGLLRDGEGVAAKALTELGISLDDVRSDVIDTIGQGTTVPTGHIPFTPRAKKVLELSLREALQLGHNYIGTEHMLLGLVHERQGVAAQILVRRGAQLDRVRAQVVGLLSGSSPGAGQPGASEAERLPEGAQPFPQPEALLEEGSAPATEPRCPRCRAELKDTVRYRILEVEPVEGEGETRAVAFALCRRCGTSYGAVS
jgi:ATP-dependent Clp protease ATP-binding subunit ClpC